MLIMGPSPPMLIMLIITIRLYVQLCTICNAVHVHLCTTLYIFALICTTLYTAVQYCKMLHNYVHLRKTMYVSVQLCISLYILYKTVKLYASPY